MKLLSVITTMSPESGGPAQGIRNNIPYWEMEGIEPSILSFDAPNSDFLDKSHSIAIGPTHNKWAYMPKVISWLMDHLQNYDAILIHGLWLYNGYAVTKAIKKLKRMGRRVPKVYIMPHGMLDPYFQKAKERKLKAIRNLIYWELIEKNVINSADGILFTCEEELRLAKCTFSGYQPNATYNIGYGIIPPPPFSDNQLLAFYEKCSLVKGRPYFLFLSRIHQKKGVDILLHAYASTFTYCSENGITLPDLVIAGPGMDTAYGDELRYIQTQYPDLSEKIHYPGMLQGDAKWGAIYCCELFVLPSHQENFGIAIVESMACKKAVIVSNKVNIWREIDKWGAGIIIEDVLESLIEALKKWINLQPEEKKLIGERAYIAYGSHFTAEQASKNFVNIISKKS